MPPDDLREVLAEGGLKDQLFDLAQALLVLQPPRPARHLAQCLDISRVPGQRVGGTLLAVQCGA